MSSWGFACHNRKEPPNTALVNKARLWCPADQHINSAHAMERDSREVVASGYDKGKHVILDDFGASYTRAACPVEAILVQ